MPLPIFKSVENISTVPNIIDTTHSNNKYKSFTVEVLEFFDKIRKTKDTELLRQGLIETLEILDYPEAKEDTNIGYKLVTMLDNKEGWDKKRKPNAWKYLQEQFCPNYHQMVKVSLSDIRNPIDSKKIKMKSMLGRLFTEKDFSTNDCITRSYIGNPRDTFNSKNEIECEDKFIYDDSVIEAVSSYLNSLGKEAVNLKVAIIANIEYIQNIYRPGGKHANRAGSLSNRDVIKHLINLCFSEKNTTNRITRTSRNESIINQLEGYLLSCYYTDW